MCRWPWYSRYVLVGVICLASIPAGILEIHDGNVVNGWWALMLAVASVAFLFY